MLTLLESGIFAAIFVNSVDTFCKNVIVRLLNEPSLFLIIAIRQPYDTIPAGEGSLMNGHSVHFLPLITDSPAYSGEPVP